MRWKPLLFSAAALALAAVPARAQFLGPTTVIAPGPGVFVGAPTVVGPVYPTTVIGPVYPTTVMNPYAVVAPAPTVVVRRSVVLAPTVIGAPAVVAPPVVPGLVPMSPGVRVVRPGWGWGPGFVPGPGIWRRW